MTRTRVVHHAGAAWAAAVAGAWLVAASCRTISDTPLPPLAAEPGAAQPARAAADRPIRVGVRVEVARSVIVFN